MKGNASETLVRKREERSELATNLSSVKKQINNIVSNPTRLQVKTDDLSGLKGKFEGLKNQAGELHARNGGLDREIDRLERQQIDTKELRKVFEDFAVIYSQASPEARRQILNIIIEGISSTN